MAKREWFVIGQFWGPQTVVGPESQSSRETGAHLERFHSPLSPPIFTMALATKASLIPLVDAVKTTIETMSSDPDVAHEKLLNQINTLVLAAESPLETIYRIGHQVRHRSNALDAAV